MLTFRKSYFVLSVALLAIEIGIALFVHDDIVRPFGGDFLVVILLYTLIRSFSTLSVPKSAFYALTFSFLIETLQYFKILKLLRLEHIDLARVVIGTTFSWSDIYAYTLGILLILFIESNFNPSRSTWKIS